MAFEEDLGHATNFLRAFLGGLAESDVREASHLPAVHADKMRMLALVRIIGVPNFEPPNMVAQFRAGEQIRFRQIGEIAEDRSLIKAQGNQDFRQFGMREGSARPPEMLQHCEAGRCGAQTDTANHFSQFCDFVFDILKFLFGHDGAVKRRQGKGTVEELMKS